MSNMGPSRIPHCAAIITVVQYSRECHFPPLQDPLKRGSCSLPVLGPSFVVNTKKEPLLMSERALQQIEDHPTPNKNGSHKRRGGFVCHILGSVCHIFCRNPSILADFCAMWTPIVWHILGAYFLQIWGVVVVRIYMCCQLCILTQIRGEDVNGNPHTFWKRGPFENEFEEKASRDLKITLRIRSAERVWF